MQNLKLVLGKETDEPAMHRHIEMYEGREELNSYSDLIGDAISNYPAKKAKSKIYKLDYLDNIPKKVEL